ncbi:GroES-like protein [Rhizodiscina lignyota]|uniref:GroES-like protein n=1 Tax=Rhizodiscina lignyota TaxID=1504668 RepID=A0A9P4M881_9PEZI|nr:GroES-like protein [Rhizodiscina lignyota]
MMRAVRWHGDERGLTLQYDEISKPDLRPGWVLVKNAWSGICGSDLHEYLHGPKNGPLTPHPVTGETLPTGVGHEFSGTVAAVGEGVSDLDVGQKVAVFPSIMDHTCYYCKEEIFGLCKSRGFMGFSGYGGGMQEYVCVERVAIHKVPEHVPLDIAALTEPLAVAWHAVALSEPKPTDIALVLGAGPIGISVIMCLKSKGVERIYVSEPSTNRASRARAAGALEVFNPIETDVVAAIQAVSDGLGAHILFETAGVQSAIDAAFKGARGKARVVGIAKYAKPVSIWPNEFNKKGLSYIQSNIYTRKEFQEVVDAIASGLFQNPESMITLKVPLENAIEGAFEELLRTKDKHCKILVQSDSPSSGKSV